LRILIRTSKTAIWAHRLGSVAVPLLLISVLLHRLQLIVGDVFLAAAGAAGLVALLAVLVALVALVRLWFSGDQGWGKALQGLLLGALCVAPFGYYTALALHYPPVTDIATTDRGLLPLMFEPGTAAMPPPKLLSAATIATIFPNVASRDYPLGAAQTYEVIKRQVEDNGWDIRLDRAPTPEGGVGQLNAQIMTLPGWREEAVLRVTGDATSAKVDMRSASLNAPHDFGSNGERIELFLTALDDAVTILLRDNPNANQPVEIEPDAEPVTPPSG